MNARWMRFLEVTIRNDISHCNQGILCLVKPNKDDSSAQGVSQDLQTGCPKLAIVKFWGVQILKGDYTQISTINMYKFIEIRHDIIIQCHGSYMEMKKFNYMLEIDILRNF